MVESFDFHAAPDHGQDAAEREETERRCPEEGAHLGGGPGSLLVPPFTERAGRLAASKRMTSEFTSEKT